MVEHFAIKNAIRYKEGRGRMSHLDRQHMTNGKGKIIGEEEKEEEEEEEEGKGNIETSSLAPSRTYIHTERARTRRTTAERGRGNASSGRRLKERGTKG